MKNRAIKKFKQRWKRIDEIQDRELRGLSIREKLYQLNAIVRLAVGMKLNFSEDRETLMVRSRWIFLKRDNP